MKKILLKYYYKILKIKASVIIRYNQIYTLKKKSPNVSDTDETLEKIVESGCSVSRYGDGEFALIQGENLKFQIYDDNLSKKLKEILKSNDENHIVCIPCIFNDRLHITEKARLYWEKYLNLNINKIYKSLDFNKNYYDTQVTRLYIDTEDKSKVSERFIKIKKLWQNRQIVIVEGNKSKLGVGNDLFENTSSIKRIICPAENAFSRYEDILNEVNKVDKANLILIALGPTATVLSYDLHKLGYQAVDIGHIDIEYEWFLQGVMEKCPIDNKYNGEVGEGIQVSSIYDKEYKLQIIQNIN